MGFSAPSSNYLDDLAQQKAAQEALAQYGGQAQQAFTGALQGMDKQQNEDATLKRQAGLDAAKQAQIGVENTRADEAAAQSRNNSNLGYQLQLQRGNAEALAANQRQFADDRNNAARLKLEGEHYADERTNNAGRLKLDSDHYDTTHSDLIDQQSAQYNLEQQRLDEAKAKDAADNARALEVARMRHGGGGAKTKKELTPKDLDQLVSGPRDLIGKLDAIGDPATIPGDATGWHTKAASFLESTIPFAGPELANAAFPERAAFEQQAMDAVIQANNALDRKTNKETMLAWKAAIHDSLAKGPEAYAKVIAKIKTDLLNSQSRRESDLSASGYDVPAGGAGASGVVRMTDGKETRDVPAQFVEEARGEGFHEAR